MYGIAWEIRHGVSNFQNCIVYIIYENEWKINKYDLFKSTFTVKNNVKKNNLQFWGYQLLAKSASIMVSMQSLWHNKQKLEMIGVPQYLRRTLLPSLSKLKRTKIIYKYIYFFTQYLL